MAAATSLEFFFQQMGRFERLDQATTTALAAAVQAWQGHPAGPDAADPAAPATVPGSHAHSSTAPYAADVPQKTPNHSARVVAGPAAAEEELDPARRLPPAAWAGGSGSSNISSRRPPRSRPSNRRVELPNS